MHIAKSEEERADRYACHLFENPEDALVGMKLVFEKTEKELNNPNAESFATKSCLEKYITVLECFENPLSIKRHPSDQERLEIIQEEISTIRNGCKF